MCQWKACHSLLAEGRIAWSLLFPALPPLSYVIRQGAPDKNDISSNQRQWLSCHSYPKSRLVSEGEVYTSFQSRNVLSATSSWWVCTPLQSRQAVYQPTPGTVHQTLWVIRSFFACQLDCVMSSERLLSSAVVPVCMLMWRVFLSSKPWNWCSLVLFPTTKFHSRMDLIQSFLQNLLLSNVKWIINFDNRLSIVESHRNTWQFAYKYLTPHDLKQISIM